MEFAIIVSTPEDHPMADHFFEFEDHSVALYCPHVLSDDWYGKISLILILTFPDQFRACRPTPTGYLQIYGFGGHEFYMKGNFFLKSSKV